MLYESNFFVNSHASFNKSISTESNISSSSSNDSSLSPVPKNDTQQHDLMDPAPKKPKIAKPKKINISAMIKNEAASKSSNWFTNEDCPNKLSSRGAKTKSNSAKTISAMSNFSDSLSPSANPIDLYSANEASLSHDGLVKSNPTKKPTILEQYDEESSYAASLNLQQQQMQHNYTDSMPSTQYLNQTEHALYNPSSMPAYIDAETGQINPYSNYHLQINNEIQSNYMTNTENQIDVSTSSSSSSSSSSANSENGGFYNFPSIISNLQNIQTNGYNHNLQFHEPQPHAINENAAFQAQHYYDPSQAVEQNNYFYHRDANGVIFDNGYQRSCMNNDSYADYHKTTPSAAYVNDAYANGYLNGNYPILLQNNQTAQLNNVGMLVSNVELNSSNTDLDTSCGSSCDEDDDDDDDLDDDKPSGKQQHGWKMETKLNKMFNQQAQYFMANNLQGPNSSGSNNNSSYPQLYRQAQIGGNGQTSGGKRKRKRILNRLQRAEATMREKRRMLKLNKAFEELRKVLPISEFAKNKLSRAETLKSAIEYIEKMSELLSL